MQSNDIDRTMFWLLTLFFVWLSVAVQDWVFLFGWLSVGPVIWALHRYLFDR